MQINCKEATIKARLSGVIVNITDYDKQDLVIKAIEEMSEKDQTDALQYICKYFED